MDQLLSMGNLPYNYHMKKMFLFILEIMTKTFVLLLIWLKVNNI